METAGEAEHSRRHWLASSRPGGRNQERSGSASFTGIGGERGRRAQSLLGGGPLLQGGLAQLPLPVRGRPGGRRWGAAAFQALSAGKPIGSTTSPLPYAHTHTRLGNSLAKLCGLWRPNTPRKSERAAVEVWSYWGWLESFELTFWSKCPFKKATIKPLFVSVLSFHFSHFLRCCLVDLHTSAAAGRF